MKLNGFVCSYCINNALLLEALIKKKEEIGPLNLTIYKTDHNRKMNVEIETEL